LHSSRKLSPASTKTRVFSVAMSAELAELPLASTQNLKILVSPDSPKWVYPINVNSSL